MRIALAILTAALAAPAFAEGENDATFAERPAFSRGDLPGQTYASCENVRAMAEGVGTPPFRVDLSVRGALTLVKTDGALWYLVMCGDLRIMCVTYQSNDMSVGEAVVFKGAYRGSTTTTRYSIRASRTVRPAASDASAFARLS